jgi:hypothetical protein
MRSLKPGDVSIDPIAQAPPRHANRLHHYSGDRGSPCSLLAEQAHHAGARLARVNSQRVWLTKSVKALVQAATTRPAPRAREIHSEKVNRAVLRINISHFRAFAGRESRRAHWRAR